LPFVGNYAVTSPVTYRRNFKPETLAKDPDLQQRNGQPHAGTDYGMPINTLLLACATGKVLSATNPASGDLSILHYDAKSKTYYVAVYRHLNSISVAAGASVYRGQIVAYSGNKGLYSSGPHLHIEIRKSDANGSVLGYSNEEEFYSNVIDGRKAFSRPGVQYTATEAALVENEIAIATINSAIQATG
jgi:murein DD-endopeptidase MepM/ murein hydrolase activator NlpD